jgi:hypothetical protein
VESDAQTGPQQGTPVVPVELDPLRARKQRGYKRTIVEQGRHSAAGDYTARIPVAVGVTNMGKIEAKIYAGTQIDEPAHRPSVQPGWSPSFHATAGVRLDLERSEMHDIGVVDEEACERRDLV